MPDWVRENVHEKINRTRHVRQVHYDTRVLGENASVNVIRHFFSGAPLKPQKCVAASREVPEETGKRGGTDRILGPLRAVSRAGRATGRHQAGQPT